EKWCLAHVVPPGDVRWASAILAGNSAGVNPGACRCMGKFFNTEDTRSHRVIPGDSIKGRLSGGSPGFLRWRLGAEGLRLLPRRLLWPATSSFGAGLAARICSRFRCWWLRATARLREFPWDA